MADPTENEAEEKGKEEAAAAAVAVARDEVADALSDLFSDVSLMVKGELEGSNNQLLMLEKMNRRVAEEYTGFGDVASGLRVFVEQLSRKNRGFEDYVLWIDAMERQVSEFEAVVSELNEYVSVLEKKVVSVYGRPTTPTN